MTETKHSKWFAEKGCLNCKELLRDWQIFYSHGICPYCGYNSGCSITKHFTRSVRWTWEEKPFLWFFKRKTNKRKEIGNG